MAGERTNRKRLDDIEVQIGNVKEELGDVKEQVTNHIPSTLKALKKDSENLFILVNENAQINSSTLNKAMRIIEIMAPYTHFRDVE